MRSKGICYDTGFLHRGQFSRADFDLTVVRRELEIIRDDLHCTAVRIVGGDADRLTTAASVAAELGLEIWFSPYPLECSRPEMLALFADCARRAEALRRGGAAIVFVAGAELTLMNPGFLPGDTHHDRVRLLTSAPADLARLIARATRGLEEFLAEAVAVVRAHFGGAVTYASTQLERIDWTPFDIVSIDLYRTAATAGRFREGVRALVAQGKPLAITEFGCATFTGASAAGAQGLDIVEYDDHRRPLRLRAPHTRDEQGQAATVRELLEIFDAEGVDSAFVFVLALYDHLHRPDGDPCEDLDLAGYGVVKVLDGVPGTTYPELPWEPKAAFSTVARYYAEN
ncbi:hypothetical protein [Nocardia farcinica]|uniref:Abortive infection protein n=1 Tax=Nocardia farcinica TaxID=37329 RepID=A0A449GHE1_NOCFR|nr:hypothetical protein [Nocardia farcinica]MBF6141352.1 hypothetical protein [Nocardia farcinica]MBF6383351.1 hypothetical protein [Nocardia farcinica]MBF6521427.1 hypothetical protein [Nocardia farcinica]MBF6535951.1 hypothetical protein [Nocardia farcinica]VFA92108.1 Uncharacterised protein [Nocardia farcinica]